jgi:hypothetical protein
MPFEFSAPPGIELRSALTGDTVAIEAVTTLALDAGSFALALVEIPLVDLSNGYRGAADANRRRGRGGGILYECGRRA